MNTEEDTIEAHSSVDSTVLSVDSVSHRFGELSVLRGIDTTIERGSVTAIVGPNGSGKTTLIRVLSGQLSPTTGRVRLKTDADRPLGYVPQENYFRPELSVRETLRFYESLLSDSHDTDEMLRQVGLKNVERRRIDALSGGMLRLLGVAQAMLGNPPLVLLDEPTSSLDPRMTNHVHDVAAKIAGSDAGVVLTTHDLGSVERVDRLMILNRGELVADGSPNDIKTKTDTNSLSEAFLELVGEDPTVQTGQREEP